MIKIQFERRLKGRVTDSHKSRPALKLPLSHLIIIYQPKTCATLPSRVSAESKKNYPLYIGIEYTSESFTEVSFRDVRSQQV